MALINCPECGKEVEEGVLTCPNCGFPIKNKAEQPIYKNKRYIGIVMCIIGYKNIKNKGNSNGVD